MKATKILLAALFILICYTFALTGYAADYPLYLRFMPYTPPNLHLQTVRATNAYYIPGMNTGVTYNFDMVPTVAGTLSLASGPIPITLAVYRSPSGCSGAKSVTVNVQYNISGTFVNIGSQTQTINVPTSGAIVPTFAFNGISSANTYVLNTGDYIRISVTANTTRLCLVNEYPLGGSDADASQGVFQTGPMFSVNKSSTVISDPINGTTNPMAIPGAIVLYTVTIQNAATASGSGSNVIVTDPIPSSTTYNANSITLNSALLTDANDTDAGTFDGSAIRVDVGNMAPAETQTVTFKVVID